MEEIEITHYDEESFALHIIREWEYIRFISADKNYISRINVPRERRNRGIGSRLLEELGYSTVTLH